MRKLSIIISLALSLLFLTLGCAMQDSLFNTMVRQRDRLCTSTSEASAEANKPLILYSMILGTLIQQ